MTNDWDAVMADATAIAQEAGLQFHELRNAWGNAEVERDAEFYDGHGVTCSDMNHMLYGAMKSYRDEVVRFAQRLGRDCAERNRIINDIAQASGQHPDLVLQQLREFFAPLEVRA